MAAWKKWPVQPFPVQPFQEHKLLSKAHTMMGSHQADMLEVSFVRGPLSIFVEDYSCLQLVSISRATALLQSFKVSCADPRILVSACNPSTHEWGLNQNPHMQPALKPARSILAGRCEDACFSADETACF